MCFPTHSKKETKAERHHNVRSRLFYLLLFSTDSDTLWYVWVSLNSLRLRKWLGNQPSPASQARKRQTSEIRHSFHLAEPVEGLEGPRAYITKTNIRPFRGLHHKNGIKLVGFSCFLCAGKLQRCRFKASVLFEQDICTKSLTVAAGLDNLMTSRIIKLHHMSSCCST